MINIVLVIICAVIVLGRLITAINDPYTGNDID